MRYHRGSVETDYVLVFKLSRFGRNAKDILNSLTYIQRYGVNLICKEDGLDSSTSMGKMMITILGAVAEMERENILAQTMLGREEKAKQGGWNGGFAPYGYELADGKLNIKEDEADVVKLVFDQFVNGGMGYSTIAGYLNRRGFLDFHQEILMEENLLIGVYIRLRECLTIQCIQEELHLVEPRWSVLMEQKTNIAE